MSDAAIIKGFYSEAGPCLVTIDDQVLALPPIDRRVEFRHSPTGFQWSYQGSGPAELARALLIACLPDEKATRYPKCYQAYKREVIAGLPKSDFTMVSTDVIMWYERWKAERGSCA
jgi:hypothetical protein